MEHANKYNKKIIHTYIHTHIHTYTHTYIPYAHTYIHTYTHTYIHTHTYIRKYIRTCIYSMDPYFFKMTVGCVTSLKHERYTNTAAMYTPFSLSDKSDNLQGTKCNGLSHVCVTAELNISEVLTVDQLAVGSDQLDLRNLLWCKSPLLVPFRYYI